LSLQRTNKNNKIKIGKPLIVIITGLSGSGKTVALRALEDSGFFCVDNLPITLIDSFLSISVEKRVDNKIGIGIDIREKDFLREIGDVLSNLKKRYRVEILYLEADKDVLIRRFKETRRPHPLGGELEKAIMDEKKALTALKEASDKIIDTSSFTPHQLREYIKIMFGVKTSEKKMTLTLISFGFKYGVPQNVDLLFDARFLPNPNFVPELKELSGVDKSVSDYVFKHRVSNSYVKKIKDLIDFVIPLYIKEGRTYVTIGIGCTGGNHRSPAIVERLNRFLKKYPLEINIVHRDLK
jgi:UPF0042 nucleotide-binding protein